MCSGWPGNGGLCATSCDQNLFKKWPRVLVPCHLAAVMDKTEVAQKKNHLVFSLATELDNEVEMTLSLIKVISRSH